MKLTLTKQVVPHLVAIAVFYILTIIFFHPVFLQNKNLNQYDILQWQGSSKEIKDFREAQGEEPLWTNSMFGGMPAYMIDVDWTNDAVRFLQSVYTLWLPHPVRLVFACMVSYYILLLAFGISSYLSMAGAVGFAFSSYNIIGIVAGHNARIGAIAFAPLILAGIHKTFEGRKRIGFALAALGLALHLRVNHLQITYYLLILIVAYTLSRAVVEVKEGRIRQFLKHSAILVLAAIVGVGTFFGEFWATYSYSKYTQRGQPELAAQKKDRSNEDGLDKEYAFRYSNGIIEPLTLLIPNFYGGGSQGSLDENSATAAELRRMGLPRQQIAGQVKMLSSYWGKQPGTSPYYAGAIIIFLAVLGGLVVPGKTKYWMLAASVLGIMLTWGHNFPSFNYFLFDHLPGYNKFRSVTFALCIPLMCLPLLGLLGLQRGLSSGFSNTWMRQFYISAGIVAGFALLCVLLAGIGSYRSPNDAGLEQQYPSLMEAIRTDRQSLLREDAFRSLIFVVLAGAVIFFWAKNRLKALWASAAVAALIALDVTTVSSRYINQSTFQPDPSRTYFSPTEADKAIMADKDYYRVFYMPDPFNDGRTSYFHHSVGGYHAAKLRRYQDLIEHCLSDEAGKAVAQAQSGSADFSELGVVNMLNTRYFKFGESRKEVITNADANGPAWLVGKVSIVNSPDEEIEALCGLDTKTEAVIDGTRFAAQGGVFDSTGSIALEVYSPNQLVYKADTHGESMAVFSEIYYPEGWVARIDGAQVPVLRCNYVLRALKLPAGKHKITFSFEPEIYQVGNKIMLGSSMILLIVIVWVFGYQLRKEMFN